MVRALPPPLFTVSSLCFIMALVLMQRCVPAPGNVKYASWRVVQPGGLGEDDGL